MAFERELLIMNFPDLEYLCYQALCAMSYGVIINDDRGSILYLNRMAEQLTGWSADQAIGSSLNDVFVIYQEEEHVRYLPVLDKVPDVLILPDYLILVNNNTSSETYISGKITSFTDETGSFTGRILVFHDATLLKKRDLKIRYNSFHDSLTGLYNRPFFETEMQRLNSKRMLPLSLILGDANGLKLVNDAFGHAEGDRLLKKVAGVLREVCRKEDIIARVGGDEFAILLPCVGHKEVSAIVQRIRESCARLEPSPIPVSIALGTATMNSHIDKVESIFSLAEERMYSAKLNESRAVRNEIISSIRKSLEVHADETQAHGNRIKELSLKIADRIGLSEYERNQLELLAMIHDIGKIAIPKSILSKPGKLGIEEWHIVRRHCEIGYRIAAYSPELASLADAILSHHEHWDGKGYPQGLSGHQIPIISRIIAITDAYDILTHGRPYRSSITSREALAEIRRCAGTQFDPDLVEHFLIMMEEQLLEQAL